MAYVSFHVFYKVVNNLCTFQKFTFYPLHLPRRLDTPFIFLALKIVRVIKFSYKTRPIRFKSFVRNYIIVWLGWEKSIVESVLPFISTELSYPKVTGVHLTELLNISLFLLLEYFITITRHLFAYRYCVYPSGNVDVNMNNFSEYIVTKYY